MNPTCEPSIPTGRTTKIAGLDLGEDPLGAFQAENGLLTIGYDSYDGSQDRFGPLGRDDEVGPEVGPQQLTKRLPEPIGAVVSVPGTA